MSKNNTFSQSLIRAISGLRYLLKNEKNARIHLAATVAALILSIYLKISWIEWLFIILSIFLVWIAELFNTSMENVFNLIEPEKNELVKNGKDISAAAVLLTACFSAIIGLLVLGPALLNKLSDWFSR